MKIQIKPLIWIGSSKKKLMSLPQKIQVDFGYALFLAQGGRQDPQAKPLKGFNGNGVLEVVSSLLRSTYRIVYTTDFKDGIYVLHCFQKKSTQGISTNQSDMNLIFSNYKSAKLNSQEIFK